MEVKLRYWPVRWGLSFVGFLTVSALTLGFSFNSTEFEDKVVQTEKIEETLNDLSAAMSVVSIRQSQIQKVMGIIAQYNQEMNSKERYEIAQEIYTMSLKYSNLDVDLICATITHETIKSWKADILSPAGAIGLMQIMPATGMFVAQSEGIPWTRSREILTNPIYNIRIGCRYLSTLIDLFGMEGGLAAYNGGQKRAALWLAKDKADGILWNETQAYIPAVMKLYQEMKSLPSQG